MVENSVSKILIADQNSTYRAAFAEALSSLGHHVAESTSSHEVIARMKEATPHLVFIDLHLPDIGGVQIANQLRKKGLPVSVPIVVLTATIDEENISNQAIKVGDLTYLTKPVKLENLKNDLVEILEIMDGGPPETDEMPAASDELIGSNAMFKQVQQLVKLASIANSNVLLIGEKGTGKNLIAKKIHESRKRGTEEFRPISSTAIDELLNNKLPSNCTIYLQELEELETPQQSKLLNWLRDNSQDRIISSSSKSIATLLAEGKVRGDLLYRLSIFPISVPPLRSRGSDILVLAQAFLEQLSPEQAKVFSADAAKALLEHQWTGNVLELSELVKRAAAVSGGATIDVHDLFENYQASERGITMANLLAMDYHAAISLVERLLLEKALKEANGNRTLAAKALGIHRQLLYAKLKEHKLG